MKWPIYMPYDHLGGWIYHLRGSHKEISNPRGILSDILEYWTPVILKFFQKMQLEGTISDRFVKVALSHDQSQRRFQTATGGCL